LQEIPQTRGQENEGWVLKNESDNVEVKVQKVKDRNFYFKVIISSNSKKNIRTHQAGHD
jgi:hypothetical protein